MSIENFPLAWRWTQSSHKVLPPDVLALLTPLGRNQTDLLYRRGEKAVADIAATSPLQHIAEQPEVTREWLQALPIDNNSLIHLIWSRDTGISLPWNVFVEYWDDFCYPSSDDVFVFPELGDAVLAWNHEEIFQYVERVV